MQDLYNQRKNSKLGQRTKYQELCKTLAWRIGNNATEKSADKYLQTLYKIMLEQLELNGEFVITDFGKFYLEHLDGSEMIATGKGKEKKYIYASDRDVIKFTPFKGFKEEVNKKYEKFTADEHGNRKDIPLNCTVAMLFQKHEERRKERENNG